MRTRSYPALTLFINYYSAAYVILGIAIPYIFGYPPVSILFFILFWIYLFPPLLCRVFIVLLGRPTGTVDSHSTIFLTWWFLTQLQIIFARFPFLEEILRIFPGLYNLWLNLWGAKVSLLTYWSPGVTVIDRYHINTGKGVIIGGGCRIGAHVITLGEEGHQHLTLAPVLIENHSLIGIHAAIGPGCHVYPKETVPAGKVLKPFYSWKEGKIQRPTNKD